MAWYIVHPSHQGESLYNCTMYSDGGGHYLEEDGLNELRQS